MTEYKDKMICAECDCEGGECNWIASGPYEYARQKWGKDCETFSRLIEEMRPMAGEVVLLGFTDLVRFHGVGQDEEDFYYIVQELGGYHQSKVYWSSAVGPCERISDQLKSYEDLDRIFTINGIKSQPYKVMVERDGARWDIENNTVEIIPTETWNKMVRYYEGYRE